MQNCYKNKPTKLSFEGKNEPTGTVRLLDCASRADGDCAFRADGDCVSFAKIDFKKIKYGWVGFARDAYKIVYNFISKKTQSVFPLRVIGNYSTWIQFYMQDCYKIADKIIIRGEERAKRRHDQG